MMEALRDEVEETKHNIPIIAGIVMMLAAVLVTVGGNSISVGCDGGIAGAIDGLQMTHRMRNQWADWCLEVQRNVDAELCGAEDSTRQRCHRRGRLDSSARLWKRASAPSVGEFLLKRSRGGLGRSRNGP